MSRKPTRHGMLPLPEEIKKKLEKSVNEGNAYGALQLYKTYSARYAAAEKYNDALDILEAGAIIQLNHSEITSGAELATLFVEILIKGKFPFNDEILDRIRKIYQSFPKISMPQHLADHDEDDMEKLSEALVAAKTRVEMCSSFLKSAIRWSAEYGTSKSGFPELHFMLAEYIYSESPELDMAKVTIHFVRGNNPEKFASTLVNFMGKCYPGEDDLAIARAILMYLSQGNLRDANKLMDELQKQLEAKQQALPKSDLIQFVVYLLKTLERDALPLFKMLRQKYQPSIDREHLFDELLDDIAEMFYGVRRQVAFPGMFGDIFKAMTVGSTLLSGSDDSVLTERPWKTSDARLVLEDGSVWAAKSFGAPGTQVGEVVFNTSLTGYQEILTDPSYAGQFVLMTNPHIGNTGVNLDDEESRQCFLGGLVIRSISMCTSNWRCRETLGDYLAKQNIMAIYDVDTRAITRRLREDGSLIGVLSTEEFKTDNELIEMARKWRIVGVDLISGVSCEAPYTWSEKTDNLWEFKSRRFRSDEFHVVAYDFGIKRNILRRMASHGCNITVVPSKWPASETLKMKPDGVLFSNGPGDPAAVPYAVDTVKGIIGKVPIFGICMGHQLLGQALGGKTYKMKFGHHGGNHPVHNLRKGCIEISAQNHNYAVDPVSLPPGVEMTHVNLNDNSCAGFRCCDLKLMSLQYHPESSPGPHDSDLAFEEFVQLMRSSKS